MDNRIKLPSTLVDFNVVGLTGQAHDTYPAPGQARYDHLRMYLIGLLSNQSGTVAPTQYRPGTAWFNTADQSLNVYSGGSFKGVGAATYLEPGYTLLDWYQAVKTRLVGPGGSEPFANAVFKNESYTNPSWVASLAGSKLTGTVSAALLSGTISPANLPTYGVGSIVAAGVDQGMLFVNGIGQLVQDAGLKYDYVNKTLGFDTVTNGPSVRINQNASNSTASLVLQRIAVTKLTVGVAGQANAGVTGTVTNDAFLASAGAVLIGSNGGAYAMKFAGGNLTVPGNISGTYTGSGAGLTGIPQSGVAGLVSDLAATVHLAGTETVTGAKTFSTPPVLGSLTGLLKAGSGTLAVAVAGTDYPTVASVTAKAADTAVVHNTGAETVAGVKTFSSAPVLGSLTGLLKAASGTLAAAVADTDYASVSSVTAKATDTLVTHLAGTETITGAKTFSTAPVLGSFTGVLKATTGTLAVAVAGTDYPTVASVTAKATDTLVVHLAGTETVTGAKTFSALPVLGSLTGLVKAASGTLSAAVAGTDYATVASVTAKATDTLVVHLAGAETITGVKTFAAPASSPCAIFKGTDSDDIVRHQTSAGVSLLVVDKSGRLSTANTVATLTADVGAGTGGTQSVAGTDTNGAITVTTGTGPSASASVAVVSFSSAVSSAPKAVILTPANAATAALSGVAAVYVSAVSTSSFTISVGTTALADATLYKWYYLVIG